MILWKGVKGSPQKIKPCFGNLSQIWADGVADSQTRSKPPQNQPENRLFDPNFVFGVPKSPKNPWVGGWLHRFGETFPKIRFHLLGASLSKKML